MNIEHISSKLMGGEAERLVLRFLEVMPGDKLCAVEFYLLQGLICSEPCKLSWMCHKLLHNLTIVAPAQSFILLSLKLLSCFYLSVNYTNIIATETIEEEICDDLNVCLMPNAVPHEH